MLIQEKPIMSKGKKSKKSAKEFTSLLKSSGFEGNLQDFGEKFLSMTRDAIYYQLREHGKFNPQQADLIIEQMKNGKHRQYGIRDVSLTFFEKFLGKQIPQNEAISIQGDNIAVNQSSVNVQTGGQMDYKALYDALREENEKLKREKLVLETKLEAYKELLNEGTQKD